MKMALLRSRQVGPERKEAEKYLHEYDTRFAERVLGNLRGARSFCTACGPDCNGCRDRYRRRYGPDIAAVIDFPAVLPYLLEQPWDYVPREMPRVDVLLIISIHEQILLEILKVCKTWGTRGVVVPLEAPDWISGAARARAREICDAKGIEVAFPKPFCSFRPPEGSVLSEFRRYFHIGRPEVDLEVKENRIARADVKVSAACGATYCVARWLVDRSLEENIEIEVVSRQWHAYPCTASMERDPELNDDTPLHIAGQAHYGILAPYKHVAGLEGEQTVVSPLGTHVQKLVPPSENLARIEQAKALVLAELEGRPEVPLAELRRRHEVSPAALNSALLILKREGRIQARGTVICAAAPS